MFLKHKKGNVGVIGAVFLFIVFLINYFIWLGSWVANVGRQAVLLNNMVGIDAFFFYNLNLVILSVMILALMGYMYFGAQAQ